MKLNISKKANVNYLAKIVEIKDFTPHSNPDYTRIKCAHVDGYTIVVGIDEQPGKYVYFPTSSCINPQLLQYANLYRHSELNANAEKTGMFEDNGRVKAIKLGGQPSEGFLLPLEVMLNFIVSSTNVNFTEDDCPINTEFDEIEHNGKSFWINKKYVVEVQEPNGGNGKQPFYKKRQKKLKKFHRVIDDFFHFHYDTVLIRKEPESIQPNDLISLTHKWHGTSAIFSYIPCRHPLTWKEKIAKWLTGNEFNRYEYLWASRSVIKNANINPNVTEGFYGEGGDVWTEAAKAINPFLIKGMTIYAEIVGFTPNGGYIQKKYDYGCVPPTNGEYVYGTNYKVMVYRITLMNEDGIVHEFSAKEVQEWCKNKGLTPVIECYYGYAKDLYPEIDPKDENWCEKFINTLADDSRFYMEKNSPDCNNKVPHEGLVIKKEDMASRAWKLKCFKFLNKEQEALDKGEANIEDLA